MAEDYFIRPYQKGDEAAIVELLQLLFHGWPRKDQSFSSREYWRWKNLENPLGEALAIVVESRGKIVGCTHDYLRRIKIGEALHL
jgi:hypothetical protein